MKGLTEPEMAVVYHDFCLAFCSRFNIRNLTIHSYWEDDETTIDILKVNNVKIAKFNPVAYMIEIRHDGLEAKFKKVDLLYVYRKSVYLLRHFPAQWRMSKAPGNSRYVVLHTPLARQRSQHD